MSEKLNRRVCIAPMMDWTDRHCRYFLRLITQHAVLYSEMVHARAIIHGDKHRLLDFNEEEHPVALQLGGSDPTELAMAAKIGAEWGYDEINLNVGCPSDRVQSGQFGACLMLEPTRVHDCIAAMQDAVDVPVTVKCRIGIDKEESYDFLTHFINAVAKSGCDTFIIHARNAWLKGLSPKENREIPPLRYEYVYQLKRDFPQLEIIINGGIKEHTEIASHLSYVDGVMLGRKAYHEPYFLAEVDALYYGNNAAIISYESIVKKLLPYLESEIKKGVPLKYMLRHFIGLYHGQVRAKQWRRLLTEPTTTLSDIENYLLNAVDVV